MASRGREPETRRPSRGGHSGSFIRGPKRVAIYLRDKFRCVYCGIDLHDAWLWRRGVPPAGAAVGCATMISLDHLDGRINHHQSNLVTACLSCNATRGALERNGTVSGWREFVRWIVREEYAALGAETFDRSMRDEWQIRERNILNARRRKLNMALAKSLVTGRVRGDVMEAENAAIRD